MKNAIKKVLALILKFKKWCVSPGMREYVLHYLITAVVVGYAMNYIEALTLGTAEAIQYAFIAWGGGIFLNLIPEVAMAKPNIKDVLAGTAGGTQSLIVYFIILMLR